MLSSDIISTETIEMRGIDINDCHDSTNSEVKGNDGCNSSRTDLVVTTIFILYLGIDGPRPSSCTWFNGRGKTNLLPYYLLLERMTF
jgi:hypothetical protein